MTAVIPTYLKSAAMTAEWENRLLLIERGQLDGKEFLEGVTELVKTVMEGCKEIPEEELQRFHPREQIGICPLCGSRYMRENRIFTVPAGSVPLPCGKKTIIFPV